MDRHYDALQDADLRRRHNQVVEAIRARGLQHYLVTTSENIFYLTGATFEPLERPFFLIIGADDSRRMLVPMLEVDHMRKAWGLHEQDILFYREFPAPPGNGWQDKLLDGRVGERFAFDDGTPASSAEILKSAGGSPLDLLTDIRMVKSGWEVDQVARAARYADWGVEQVLRASWYGGTVAETYTATQALSRKIVREVADWDALATKVIAAAWPAPMSAEPHSVPRVGDRLEAGPHVAMVLTRVNGYAAESERTFFTSTPTPRERELFALMTRARDIAFDLVRPGVPCADIDGAVNAFLNEHGCADFRTRLHRCGHGFGLGNHEAPWIAEGSPHVLAQNMIISIEPGIYERGLGGFRHSDTVLVTDTGARCLTKVPTGLDELIVGKKTLRHRVTSRITQKILGLQ